MKLNNEKDIILITCPVWGVKMPPLGLAYLATNLKKKSINLEVLDLNIEVYKRVNEKLKELWKFENNKYWCDWDKDFKELLKEEIEYCLNRILSFSKTKIYAFSIQATNRLFSIEVIKNIKRKNPDKVIIAGGTGCFDDKEREQIFPLELIDFFVIGEGEVSLFELVDRLKKCFSIENIPGIVYYKNKEKRFNLRQLIEPLDKLYFPTYEEFDLKNYTEKSLALTMSRGCISRCAFCNDWKMMGKYRTRSAEHMFEEIKYHVEKNNITNFYFNDLLINGNINELEKLCDLIIKSGYKLKWVALAIPLDTTNYHLLVKMRKAGCITLNYGIESGSDRVLKNIRKPISVNSVEKVLELTRKAGINTQINFIVGFPGEKEEDVEKTMEFIKKNKANISGVTNINVCNAVAGSDISINSEKYGIIFPSEQRLRDSHWYTLDGNTFEERRRRTEKVMGVSKDLNISIFTTNLEEKVTNISDMHSKTKIADIALVVLPPWDIETPHVGLGYLAECLEKKRIDVKIFDFNIELFNKFKNGFGYLWNINNQRYWFNENKFNKTFELIKEEIKNCVNKIIDSKIKIIAFSVATPQERISMEVIRSIKKKRPELKIIVGGPSCNYKSGRKFFREDIPHLIDAYVIGEGEETLLDLIKAIKKGEDIKKIKGIMVYDNGKYSKLIERKPIEYNKIDIFPTYSQFDLSKYTNHNMITVEWSRGCIGNCSFCQHKNIWGKYRSRSPKSIINEIRYHVEKNNIRDFSVCDSTINGDLKNLEKVCDLIIESGLKIRWSGLAIPRKMNYNLLKKMKRAGCYRLEYGIESGSNKVLKLMRKIHRVKESEEVLRITHKIGIKTVIFIIVGFPGETEEDFNETLNFIKRNKDYTDLIRSVIGLHVMDGTDIKNNPKKYRVIERKDDETGYNWYSNDGNNAKERNKKVKKVILLLDELNIRYELDASFKKDKTKISDKKSYNLIDKYILKIRNPLSKGNVDILLVILPPWGTEYPPLNLAYLSTYLRSKGITTQVIDANIDFFHSANDELKNLWDMSMTSNWCIPEKFQILEKDFNVIIDEYVKKVFIAKAKIICFSVNSANVLMTKEFTKRLREKIGSQIIVGGPSIENKSVREYFYGLVDYFVIGEGEETLYKLYNNLSKGKTNIIPGVIEVNKGIESNYIPRKLLDINNIPFPTYEEFNFTKYKMNQLPFLLSRGCMRKCLFCPDLRLYPKFNHRNPKLIFDEIYHHYRKYNIRGFESHDLLINGDLIKLEEFCDLLIKSRINIEWHGQAIVRDMPMSLFRKMRKSGLKSLVLGLESASDVVLRKMGKPYTAKTAEDIIIKAKKAGINIYVNIIIGMPGEDEEDFIKTMEFLGKNKENISAVTSLNICMLFKDTILHKLKDIFNITIEREGEDSEFWYDDKGNNFELRKSRMYRMLKFLKMINIHVKQSNQFLEELVPKNNIKYNTEREKINFNYKNDKIIIRIFKKFLNNLNFNNKKDINKSEHIRKKLIPTPKYVTIDLTNSCNLNCVGCWTHSPLLKDKETSKEWKSQMIPFDTLKKFINDLSDLGTERVRLTGGGEPFLYHQIIDIIKLIKEKGMTCDITTNFMLLTKEKIKQLFELNVDELVVSLWAGDADTYVKTHPNQTRETFEKVRENLEFIAEYKEKSGKGPKVIMANVISNINYNKIEEMAKFATHVSLDELYFTLIDPIKDKTCCLLLNNKERKILLKKLNNVKKIVKAYNKKSKIHKIRVDDINRFIGKVKSKKANDGKYDIKIVDKPCYIGYIFARILANGDVVPCCRAVMYSMGNINKRSFKEIWFSEKYDKFRERGLYESKLNSYFKKIGCSMTCDNQVHNKEIETRRL